MKGQTLFRSVAITFCCSAAVAVQAQMFVGTAAQDSFCDLSPTPCGVACANSAPFTLSILDAFAEPIGNATLRLDFHADVDNPIDENLTVEVEGYSMGKITNADSTDDRFDHPTDVVADCEPVTMSGSVPLSELKAILADGKIDVTFTPEQESNDIEADECPDPRESMAVTVEYPLGGVPVPTMPATARLALALGLLLGSSAMLRTRW